MNRNLNDTAIMAAEWPTLARMTKPAILLTFCGDVAAMTSSAEQLLLHSQEDLYAQSFFDVARFESASRACSIENPLFRFVAGAPFQPNSDVRMYVGDEGPFLISDCVRQHAAKLPDLVTTDDTERPGQAQHHKQSVQNDYMLVSFRVAPETRVIVDDNDDLIRATAIMAGIGGWELCCDSETVKWTSETFRIHELPQGTPPTLAEAIGYYHPDDRSKLSLAIHKATTLAVPYDLQLRIITAKGNLRHVRTICRPQTAGEKVTKLQGSFQDITDNVLARNSLAKERLRLDHVLLGTGAGTWELDVRRAKITWDTRWAEILGYQLDELGSGSIDLWISLCHPDDRIATIKNAEDCLRGKSRYYKLETRMRHKDGHWIWIHNRGTVSQWSDNGQAEVASGACVDITERKNTEAALLESESRYRDLFDNSTAVKLLIAPENGRIVHANSAACQFYGYSPQELALLTIFEINISNQQQVQEKLGLAAACEVRQFEGQHRLANGEVRDVHVHTGPVSVNGHQLLHSIVIDITEKKRAAATIEQMQRLESLGTLAGGIAHDFNNVLTGIFGNVSLARLAIDQDDSQNAQQVTKFLDEAERSIHRATRLTCQLLTFAKGGAPIIKLIDIKDLLVGIATFDLAGSNVKAAFSFQDPLHCVFGDFGQLQQVFSNLILNAAQAMPDGGTLKIAARNTTISRTDFRNLKVGEHVAVTVRDTGVGIEPGDLGRIFEPYFSRKPTGHGLGLATSYSIIQRHNGHVEVASKPGKGTTFTILLPATQKTQTCTGELPEPHANAPNVMGKRILLMDDQPDILQVTENMLCQMGMRVTTSIDSSEAVEAFADALSRQCPFDFVILDLTVPGDPGGKFAVQQILELDPNARVLCTSGYADDPVMSDFAKFGFKNAIAKPYTFHQLKNVINRLASPADN